MSNASPTVRIFISSPGDVQEERDQARRVVENLQRYYTGVELVTVLWEDLPLAATASFQESIDFLLNKQPIDVAIFIFWSRLGSPLGPAITRPDGTEYRSGTEREFDLMLAAFERSGDKKRPVILAYTRDDDEAFIQRVRHAPKSERDEMLSQSTLVENFIREHFRDAEGHNVRAYYTYAEPITFAQRLHTHLKQKLDELVAAEAVPRWQDEPYRGLQFFDVAHAPIFQGREEETCELLERLRGRGRTGCASVVIVGASGSGKSSLARAGAAATLMQHGYDTGVKEWRVVSFVPGLGSSELLLRLTRDLAEQLPEQKTSLPTLDGIATALASDDPRNAVQIGIAPMFERAAEQAQGQVRLLLIVDQLEELWTDRRFTPEDRNRFLTAVEALARSGHVAVLATLRSDFYPDAQQVEAFLRLKQGRGHFDLLPPGIEILHRVISEPARLAGLRFERDDKTGRALDQEINKAAARDRRVLPLLQYTLRELYQQRDRERRLLTLAAYDQLGGLEGAIGRRAEEVYSEMSSDVQASLPGVMRQLVVLREGREELFTATRAPLNQVAAIPQGRALAEAFVDARLFVSDRTESGASVGVAHEALLAHWPRLKQLLEEDRDFLRSHQRVKSYVLHWIQEDRNPDFLLPSGKPLAEARDLMRWRQGDLDAETAQFITRSVQKEESARNLRRGVTVAVTLAFLLLCGVSSVVFYLQKGQAEGERDRAERNEQTAQRNLALVQVNLAELNWRTNDVGRVRQLLEATPTDHREWEWRYVKRLADGNRLTIPVRGPASSVAWSPDGKQLLGSWQSTSQMLPNDPGSGMIGLRNSWNQQRGVLSVWDAKTGKLDIEFQGDLGPMTSAACISSRSEPLLASPRFLSIAKRTTLTGIPAMDLQDGSGEPTAYSAQLWSAGGARPVRSVDSISGHFVTLNPARGLVASVVNHDANRSAVGLLAQGSRSRNMLFQKPLDRPQPATVRFHVWDVNTEHELSTWDFAGYKATGILFSHDGKQLVSSHADGSVRFWDVAQKLETSRVQVPDGGQLSIRAISPDGSRLVVAGNSEKERGTVAVVWDRTAETELGKIRTGSVLTALCFDGDGSRLAAGGWDDTVHVWDARTCAELRVFRGHADNVTGVAFHPSEPLLASCSTDATIKLWNLDEADPRGIFNAPGAPIRSLALPATGRRLAVVRDSGGVEVWNTSNGVIERELEGARCAAVSPDGHIVATGGTSNELLLHVLDSRTERTIRCQGHADTVEAAAFSVDGKRVVSVDGDDVWIVWDASSGNKLAQIAELAGSASWPYGIAFSPDGTQVLGVDFMNGLHIWNVADGKSLQTLALPQSLFAAYGMGEGKRMVALSGRGINRPAEVCIWEPGNDKPAVTHLIAGGFVHSAVVSPNGRRLFTAVEDKGVQVWDLDSGLETLWLSAAGDNVLRLALSADGNRLAGADAQGTIHIWDATPRANNQR